MEVVQIEGFRKQGKRRLASLEGCKFDLKSELPILFKAFDKSCKAYEKEIVNTPPLARARGFEASLLNSKMIQEIQNHFPDNWRFAKYKRFTLRINGYVILFKKLNGKNLPMNIKTQSVNAISNQLSLSLFNEISYTAEPILFFGYRKDKFGHIFEPKLIYIDDSKLKWTLEYDNVETNIINTTKTEINDYPEPKLRKKVQKKETGS